MATETAPGTSGAPAVKISFRRLLSNVGYLIGQAWRLDPGLIVLVFGAFILCSAGYGFLDTWLFKLLIDQITNKAAGFEAVALIIGGIAVSALAVQFLDAFAQMLAGARFVRLTGRLQEDFMRKAAGMDLLCYDDHKYFDDFVIAASQADEMISTGIFSVARIMGNVAGILAAGIFIFTISPLVAIFPVLGFAVNIITRFAITRTEYDYDMERRRLMRRADYSRRVFYQPEYAKEIKLSSVDRPLRRQFNQAIDEIEVKARKAGKTIAILSLINWIVVFTFLSFLVAPLYLAWLVLGQKSITFGGMVSTDNAQNNVRNQLDGMNYALVDFLRVGQFAERFRRFMDWPVKIEGAPGSGASGSVPGEAPVSGGRSSSVPGMIATAGSVETSSSVPGMTVTVGSGVSSGSVPVPGPADLKSAVLEIDRLSFRYNGAESDTLHDISLTVRPGEHIAIVGENGAGKTTFIKLLMRLYDVTDGCIRFGGKDIREYATADWRRLCGAVFQDYQLYGTSLAENVLMTPLVVGSGVGTEPGTELVSGAVGLGTEPGAGTSSIDPVQAALVREALELADFGRKLEKLPQGIETPMTREFSDEGTMLSGGEAQKVAIARLFARTSRAGSGLALAILDEPSSALDPRAEHILTRNMLKAAGDAAVIFISHRLSTTRNADRIYLFENGRIAEQGTHDELVKLGGSYAVMFEKQAHYYQDET